MPPQPACRLGRRHAFITMGAQFRSSADLVLDSRRAAWFPQERVLAIADLHLGYAWAHRLSGNLMPLPPPTETRERIATLQRDYQPREMVVLGDIVHRAVALPALETEMRDLAGLLDGGTRLILVAGNHDLGLSRLMAEWNLPVELTRFHKAGRYLFIHGDEPAPPLNGACCAIMGHEHPAISLGDGVTTSAKFPCFLVSERVLILPAFSLWAAGTNVRSYPFMSPLAQSAGFQEAIAIIGDKLLPVRW